MYTQQGAAVHYFIRDHGAYETALRNFTNWAWGGGEMIETPASIAHAAMWDFGAVVTRHEVW